MIDLVRLQKSFGKMENNEDKEIRFDVDGVSVVMKHLTDKEELGAMKIAHDIVGSSDKNNLSLEQELIHEMKIGTLSRSIVEIDGLSLRDEYVITDEVLPNGEKLKKTKVSVLSGMLSGLPKPYLSRLFAKYGELLAKIEIRAERAIQYEPIDFGDEIARLKLRIEELEVEKKKQEERLSEKKDKAMKLAVSRNKILMDRDREMAGAVGESVSEPAPIPVDEDGDGAGEGEVEGDVNGHEDTHVPEPKKVDDETREMIIREYEEKKKERVTQLPPAKKEELMSQAKQQTLAAKPRNREETKIEKMGVMKPVEGPEVEVYKTPTQYLSDRGGDREIKPKKESPVGSVNPNFNPRKG